MAKYVAVSRENHAGKRWRRATSYSFAAGDAATPLAGSELSRAALTMPIAFMKDGDRYVAAALLSFISGRNLYVGPDGKWLGGYVPAQLRSYPFGMFRPAGETSFVLCVDEDSDLVTEADAGGEAFFAPEGGPSDALKPILDVLTRLAGSREATDGAVAALVDAGAVEPWDLKVRDRSGERGVSGLYRIDEAALNGLSDETFLAFRRGSALTVAYAQMFSVGQLKVLEHLARLHGELASKTAAVEMPESLDSVFGIPADDMLKFD